VTAARSGDCRRLPLGGGPSPNSPNERHRLELRLIDADGQPVAVVGQDGEMPVAFSTRPAAPVRAD
jgi:hypothetical protein